MLLAKIFREFGSTDDWSMHYIHAHALLEFKIQLASLKFDHDFVELERIEPLYTIVMNPNVD